MGCCAFFFGDFPPRPHFRSLSPLLFLSSPQSLLRRTLQTFPAYLSASPPNPRSVVNNPLRSQLIRCCSLRAAPTTACACTALFFEVEFSDGIICRRHWLGPDYVSNEVVAMKCRNPQAKIRVRTCFVVCVCRAACVDCFSGTKGVSPSIPPTDVKILSLLNMTCKFVLLLCGAILDSSAAAVFRYSMYYTHAP
jgi:hypothetical protein